MTKEETSKLSLGLYIIHWKKKCGGGHSLASVGMGANGDRWFAPVNWQEPPTSKESVSHWKSVKKVEPIQIGLPEKYVKD